MTPDERQRLFSEISECRQMMDFYAGRFRMNADMMEKLHGQNSRTLEDSERSLWMERTSVLLTDLEIALKESP